MSASTLAFRFSGSTLLSANGATIGGGPMLAFAEGPAAIAVQWGADNVLDGSPPLQQYLAASSGETQVSWMYDDGAYVIRAVGQTPGFANKVVLLRATIDAQDTAGVVRFGSSLSDFIMGGAGGDTLRGGDGDDWLLGRDGADNLNGGNGNDWLYGGDTDNADDTLIGGAGDDSAAGYSGNDFLRGGAGADALFGHDGNDRLYGDAGADQLNPGIGNDTIWCGTDTDSDWIIFDRDDLGGMDLIAEFMPGTDKLALMQLYGLGLDDAARFVGSTAAMTDTGAWLIYNALTGRLQADLNGTAAGQLHDICLLVGAPALSFGDLIIH